MILRHIFINYHFPLHIHSLFIFVLPVVTRIQRNQEQLLLEDLFSNRNHSAVGRPVMTSSEAVRLKFGIEIMRLISVNEPRQYITTKLQIRQSWNNELLRWSPTDFGGVDNLHVHASHIWVPDIQLYNSMDDSGGLEKYKNALMHINANGIHRWFAPATLNSTCTMNIKYYPFDTQRCALQFGSWAYDVTKLTLTIDDKPMISEKHTISTEWDLVDIQKEVNAVKYVCCRYPFQDVTFILTLRRRPFYVVLNVVVPCTLSMIMVLISFFLPLQSKGRVTLLVTVILAFAALIRVNNPTQPKSADSTPILSVFYLTIMGESALSLTTTCIVLSIHHKGSMKKCKPLPVWVRILFLDIISRELGFRHPRLKKQAVGPYRELRSEGPHVNTDFNIKSNFMIRKNKRKDKSKSRVTKFDILRSLSGIHGKVKNINLVLNDHEKMSDIAEDWRVVAEVVDRLFFYVFFITFLLSACSILIPVYLRDKS